MIDERATTITDTDRLEWLLRNGSPLQIDGTPIQSRDQVDEQIRRSRFRAGREWEGSVAQSHPVATDEELEVVRESATPKRMGGLAHGTLFSRSAELRVLSAANRELAIFIGDLRLRRCS